MKCSKCGFDNPGKAKFCVKCASKLEIVCPSCGEANPPESNFCMNCASDLAQPTSAPAPPVELSFEEKLDKIQRYLPDGLTEKILAQRGKIEGERKQVTVMFCDAEGFSVLSERLGPEKVYALMDEVFETLIHKVHEFGGTVNKMTGDGVMALFGAPIALEDAPQRAIRSALAIQRDISRLSDRKKEETGNRQIRMRIGIHTGPVVVGSLGNDLRVEFTAVGDTVNLASRMEGLAQPGTAYVTEDTFKLTEGLFRFEALGEKEVKGKEAPVKAYRVIAPSTRRTRFDVSAERGLTPFLGRERELELLLDGLERAKSGRGQAFSIMGEAGVGKSRLLYELRKAVANQDVTFVEGRCLSYSTNVAYHPVIDLLKSTFDVHEEDNDDRIRNRVKRGLKDMGVDEASALPFFLELLSVKDSGIDAIGLSREARKDRTLEALKRIMLRGSEARPLVIAIEDLHWVDKSSEEALKSLLEAISGAQVQLIFTYRPEFVHTWGTKSYHSQVNLNRLSNRETLAMAAHILGTEVIGGDLEELVLEKTEGIPFFVEEFMKSLKDLGMIEWRDSGYYLAKDLKDLTIPSTIQDVIMARVDALPDGAKNVLQTGSAIGREFSCDLIKRVTGVAQQEMVSHLSALRDSELLYERGIFPQAMYIFRHSLTQEVAYDSLLFKRRKEIHERIGQAIEEIHRDNLDQHYGVLAEQYIAGENFEKGAEYCRLASEQAYWAASFSEAIAHAERAVACLEQLPQTDDVRREIVQTRIMGLGGLRTVLNYYAEAHEAVEPIAKMAADIELDSLCLQIYCFVKGSYSFWVEDDLPTAFKHLQDALMHANECRDPLSIASSHYWLAFSRSMNCEFQTAHRHMADSLEITLPANAHWMTTLIQSMDAFVHAIEGKADLGYRAGHKALQTAEECGDILSKAHAYTFHGLSCYYRGSLQEAEGHLTKGIAASESISLFSHVWIGNHYLAETYHDMGEYSKSRSSLEKLVPMYEQRRMFPSFVNLSKIALARAKVSTNDTDIDPSGLFECRERSGVPVLHGWMSRYIGEILLNVDVKHMSAAKDWMKKAIEADTSNGLRWQLAKDQAVYADLFQRKGDIPEARERLAKAIDIFGECGADGWVTMTEEKLKALA